tara:strand:+ start:375 stop:809 length:435 start_codon:yes stop_codon:yes gene_type:complete
MYFADKMKFDILACLRAMNLTFFALIILMATLLHGCNRAKLHSYDDRALCLYLNLKLPSAPRMKQVVQELKRRELNCQKIVADINYEYEFLKRTEKSLMRADSYTDMTNGTPSPLGSAKLLAEELRKKCLEIDGIMIAGKCAFD